MVVKEVVAVVAMFQEEVGEKLEEEVELDVKVKVEVEVDVEG